MDQTKFIENRTAYDDFLARFDRQMREATGDGAKTFPRSTSQPLGRSKRGGRIHRAQSDALRAAAGDKWRAALRTSQLASALSRDRDRETLMSYAEELEREAAALEHQANGD
jgi:hypothetical protein